MSYRARDAERSHHDRRLPGAAASDAKTSAAPSAPLVMPAASGAPYPAEAAEAIDAADSPVLNRTRLPAGSRSLEVLIVTQAVDYGVAVCVRQLTQAAIAAGHSVVVACPGKGPLPEWITRSGAGHEPVNMVRHPATRDLVDLWSLRRLARGRDVVHLHSSKAAALGRVATASLGRKRPATVVTPHYWSWFVGGRMAGLYRLIERVLAFQCDAIVAVSEREAAEGRTVLKAGGRRILLIHNGVDRIHFSPKGPRAARTSRPLITCVGRLSEQKGQDLAIRALARIRNKEAVLRLVGGETRGGETRELEALAEAKGVAHRMEWRGEVVDTAPELRAADVVIAPSRWDGMSLSLLEAMACGATVVVTDVTGSEIARGAGMVVPRNDPGALALAIDALLEDAALRRRLGKAARERSRSYDLADTMQGNLELWARLAGETARGGGRGVGRHHGVLRLRRRAPHT
jgi:glycosyltransferase involved in cell wall biosynthesis